MYCYMNPSSIPYIIQTIRNNLTTHYGSSSYSIIWHHGSFINCYTLFPTTQVWLLTRRKILENDSCSAKNIIHLCVTSSTDGWEITTIARHADPVFRKFLLFPSPALMMGIIDLGSRSKGRSMKLPPFKWSSLGTSCVGDCIRQSRTLESRFVGASACTEEQQETSSETRLLISFRDMIVHFSSSSLF